ncbi:hypothetical protein ACXZ66_05810 [Corynebacterium sp. S7]
MVALDLSLDTAELRSHATTTHSLIDELQTLRSQTVSAGLGENFTPLPGLRELGRYHGLCLNGAEGSSVSAIDFLTRLVRFASDSFEADATAFEHVEDSHAAALRGVSQETLLMSFPVRPATGPQAVGYLPTSEHVVQSAGTFSSASVESLRGGLAATSLIEVEEGARLWSELARVAQAVAHHFASTSSSLEAGSTGSVVEASTQTLREFAGQAEAIARAAQSMGGVVQLITGIVQALRGALGLLETGLAGLPAEARVLVERSFLDAIPENLMALVARALAPFASLLDLFTSGWILKGLPQLVWPDDVAARMCCSDLHLAETELHDEGAIEPDIDLDETPTETATASLSSAPALSSVGAVSTALSGVGGAPSVGLGAGVSMAVPRASSVPAGISVGSLGSIGGAQAGAGQMMAPMGAARTAAVPQNKRNPAVGTGLR